MTKRDNVVSLAEVKDYKEYALNAMATIQVLEYALYGILEATALDDAKEIAAEVLDEDLETYLEEDDLEELDFDDPDKVHWGGIEDLEEEEK